MAGAPRWASNWSENGAGSERRRVNGGPFTTTHSKGRFRVRNGTGLAYETGGNQGGGGLTVKPENLASLHGSELFLHDMQE